MVGLSSRNDTHFLAVSVPRNIWVPNLKTAPIPSAKLVTIRSRSTAAVITELVNGNLPVLLINALRNTLNR